MMQNDFWNCNSRPAAPEISPPFMIYRKCRHHIGQPLAPTMSQTNASPPPPTANVIYLKSLLIFQFCRLPEWPLLPLFEIGRATSFQIVQLFCFPFVHFFLLFW
jgi:hypothetical protein